MRNLLFALTLAALALGSNSLAAAEKLALGSPFGDHGVLQRDMAVPVWGKAEPGTKVVVQFAGQEKQGAADKGGKWMVKLDPLAASAEGRALTVKTEGGTYNKAGLPASPFQTDGAFELEPGFEPLLNGSDLTGWRYKGGEPFDGKTNASDGRYTARDGRIVVNPGKGLAQMWTTREFPGDFHLKLEFRAGVNADSGIFLRAPQLQCRDYYVAGPYKELKHYKPQDWNEIEVIVKGKVATCTCNGEPLMFTSELPPTGPIGLEADRGQMEYRRIRIKTTTAP